MKNILQHRSCYLTLVFGMLALLFSCTEDISGPDTLAEKDGPAVINYVRVTDPEVSDSLLVGAFLGNLIAIVGDNLGDTKELWFNDQKALLNPTYITDKTIIVNVPTTVPAVVTDEMRLVFSDGSELTYPFKINVPGPRISGIKSEFVPAGGVAVIKGDFFFEPMQVNFTGGVEGVVESIEKTEVRVVVPDGAEPGPISITTNFGTQESPFFFRDDRNILLDFDTKGHESWTAPTAMGIQGVTPVDGAFAYFQSDDHGAWQWVNEMTMQYWAPRGRGNVPISNGLVQDLVFKMEVNVPIEWREVRMEIFFAPSAEDHGRDQPGTVMARWQPFLGGPYTTDGWETLSIPLSEFVYTKDDGDEPSAKLEDVSNLSNVTMMMFGPAESSNPVIVAFDNIRVVPR